MHGHTQSARGAGEGGEAAVARSRHGFSTVRVPTGLYYRMDHIWQLSVRVCDVVCVLEREEEEEEAEEKKKKKKKS